MNQRENHINQAQRPGQMQTTRPRPYSVGRTTNNHRIERIMYQRPDHTTKLLPLSQERQDAIGIQFYNVREGALVCG